MEHIYLYPLTIKNDRDFEPKIVTKHSEKEWRRMLREIRKVVKNYQEVFGVKVYKVEKFMDDFIHVSAYVVDRDKFSNFGEYLEDEFADFLNKEQYGGEFPSFYKNNLEDHKYVDKFTAIFNPY